MREVISRVKIGKWGRVSGRRQGCPLSPIIFNIMLADLEEEMGKVKWGGVRLDGGEYILWLMRTMWCCWRRERRR